MERATEPINARYRVADGPWTDQAPALERPEPLDVFALLAEGMRQCIEMATAFMRATGEAMARAVEEAAPFLSCYGRHLGTSVPAGTTIVRPKRRQKARVADTWLAWDATEAQWVPVRRVAGVGWVWSA